MLALKQNTRLIIKIGYGFILAFFAMNWLPHPTSVISEDLFDGIHGMVFGVAMGLLLLGTYLNGKARRAAQRD